MLKHDNALLNAQRTPDGTTVPVARRINVAVTPVMLSAIDRVVEREHVTLTEAVRRLITYGDFVYEMTKERGATVVVRGRRGEEQELIML